MFSATSGKHYEITKVKNTANFLTGNNCGFQSQPILDEAVPLPLGI